MADTDTEVAEDAVEDAVEDGATPAEAKTEAKKAVRLQSPTLTEDQLNKIADRVVNAFEEKGAFDSRETEDKENDDDELKSEPDEKDAHGEENKPSKRSWAQKYANEGD